MLRSFAVLCAAALTLGLSGCQTSPIADDRIQVVTGINVWGEIAETIGGDTVSVTSLISDASVDPHEYAAGASDLAAVANADVIIVNGNGYDDALSQLVESAHPDATVLTVADIANTGVDNEHYWYDLAATAAVGTALAAALAAIDPAQTEQFTAAAATFAEQLDGLETRLATNAAAHPGRTALLTEPLPYYLLTAAGFGDVTPPGLTSAVEAGTEIPPAALRDAETLIRTEQVNLLARNAQTESSQTQLLVDQAASAGVPVIDFDEVLPPSTSYVDWMTGYVSLIEAIS